MELKFVPEQKNDGNDFEGYILLRSPNYKERSEVLKLIQFVIVMKDGKISTKEESEQTSEDLVKNMEASCLLVDYSERFYKEVKLKHKESGVEYKSFKDLYDDPFRTTGVLNEAAGFSIKGFEPTKNSKPL